MICTTTETKQGVSNVTRYQRSLGVVKRIFAWGRGQDFLLFINTVATLHCLIIREGCTN